MKYCKKCGNELQLGKTFCTKCGTKNLQEERPLVTRGKAINFSLSSKAKKGILIGVALMVIFIGTHFLLASLHHPAKVVQKFDEAVKSGDTKLVAELINEGQLANVVTEDEARSYIEYLTNKHYYIDLINELEENASYIEHSMPVIDANGNQLFKLEKANKWLWYDRYMLRFYPIELTVFTNIAEADLWINGRELKNTGQDNNSITTYILPGDYELKGEYKGEYGDLETTNYIDASYALNNQLEVPMLFESTELAISSNFPEAILFVNGESTGKTIENITTMGPLLTDGSITLHAERTNNGDTETSEAIQVYDHTSIHLAFEEVEVASTNLEAKVSEVEVARFMDSYFTTMVSSINAREIIGGEFVFDPNGKAYPEFKNYLGYLEQRGINHEYLGMKLIGYEEVDGGYNVTTNEDYNIYYNDGSAQYKSFESEFFVSLLDEGLRVHTLNRTDELLSEDL
ncbi:hypothetical protein BTR23_04065 [Alkalihalophilus pseudofirmus]|nr:hypothetical protein BTR23_04065 [Alkalihalophilus pseudofirmus]